MAESSSNVLRILQIFKNYSDENNYLSMKDIQHYMDVDYETKIDRRTVSSCLSILKEHDYDITEYDAEKKGYTLLERELEVSQVRLLMDAVYSSDYIPVSESLELIDKLQQFLCLNERKNYQYLTPVRNKSKTKNKNIFLNIDTLNTAIAEQKQVSFTYMDYNTNKELVPRRSEPYVGSPFNMICQDAHYYLLFCHNKHKEPSLYRIDLMKDVTITSDPVQGPVVDKNFDTAQTLTRAYIGAPEQIVLRCKSSALRYVVDEFGDDCTIMSADEETFTARIQTNANGLKFWALQFVDSVEVISPPALRKSILETLSQHRYGDES